MEAHISKAILSDIEDLMTISSEVSAEGSIKQLSVDELQRLVQSESNYLAVARSESEIVGYATCSFSWGKLHILDIAVRGSNRRMGAGRALVRHLIDLAQEESLAEVYCEVKARNLPALNLFTSVGFKFRGLFSIEDALFGLYYTPHTKAPG